MRIAGNIYLFFWVPLCLALFIGNAFADLPYIPRIEGELPDSLRVEIESQLEIFTQRDNVPLSEMHLQRRIDRDEKRYLDAAHALGYFAATFSCELKQSENPAILIVHTGLGQQYTFGAVTLQVSGNILPPADWVNGLTISEGQAALSESIVVAENLALKKIRESGYPAPMALSRDVVVDHAQQRVNVTFQIDPGMQAVFGNVDILGLKTVKEQLVLDKLPWKNGDTFQGSLLEQAQKNLFALGVFSTVDISPATNSSDAQELPITIEVTERKQRSIGIGVNYNTDDGAGIQLNWQNRNMQGLGRPLSLKMDFNQRIWGLEAQYKIDRLWRENQSLLLGVEVKTEDIDPYDVQFTRVSGTFERKLNDKLALRLGGGIHLSQVTQLDNTNEYELAFGELGFYLDHTDNTLDPTRGYKIQTRLMPYIGFDITPLFLQSDATFSKYWRLNRKAETDLEDRPLVLATRLHLGTIWGEDWRDIPADLRYYSGGAGALRGYPYKSVSAVIDGTPIGGEAIFEAALELRKKITERIGIAAFVECGSAFNGGFGDAFEDALFSVGMGGRFYSPIGPMRLDVAVPLENREGIDNLFQVYFSIGQAF